MKSVGLVAIWGNRVTLILLIAMAGIVPLRAFPADANGAIKKSQELLLGGKREEAIKVLVEAIRSEARGSKSFRELKKRLARTEELFVTTRGQQLYEVGRSLAEKDPSAAVDKLREAAQQEPSHQRVRIDLARVYLTLGECGKVLQISREGLLINPYNVDLFLLRVQSKICSGDMEDISAELTNPYIDMDEIALYLDTVHAQLLIQKAMEASAVEILNRAKQRDSQFPEIYYWLAQANAKSKAAQRENIELYLKLCREELPALRRKYSREPRTCREAKNMQEKLEALRAEAGEAS